MHSREPEDRHSREGNQSNANRDVHHTTDPNNTVPGSGPYSKVVQSRTVPMITSEGGDQVRRAQLGTKQGRKWRETPHQHEPLFSFWTTNTGSGTLRRSSPGVLRCRTLSTVTLRDRAPPLPQTQSKTGSGSTNNTGNGRRPVGPSRLEVCLQFSRGNCSFGNKCQCDPVCSSYGSKENASRDHPGPNGFPTSNKASNGTTGWDPAQQ